MKNRGLFSRVLWVSVFLFSHGLCPAEAGAQTAGDLPAEVTAETSGAGAAPQGAKVSAPDSWVEADSSQERRLQTIVNLSFTKADLKSVLNSLAKVYELNIVADESVKGTVTLNLRGISLKEGMRQILKLNGFELTLRGEIIEVTRLEEKRSTEVLPVDYLNPDIALEFLQSVASEDAVLRVDEASNGILVSDFSDRIDKMRLMLKGIDQPPRQVLIESKLMDITHTDLDNLGLALSSIGLTIPTHSLRPLSLASGALSLAGTSADLTGNEIAFTISKADDTLTATLDALIRDRRVTVIATPTILTVNNAESRIIIGEKFPIREQTQTTTGTLETTRFVDVGTTLRVTPRITSDGYIQMHIHPEVSSVSATLDEGPRITTREADTTVLVRDGQSIVIAGLLQEDETTIKGRIPLLGHIPIFGILFRNRSRDLEKKELVIIITPYIVDVHAAASLEEIPLEIQEVGTRLQVSELFSQGRSFEEGLSLKARQTPPAVRYLKAMDSYQRVVDRYPTHPFALESLWRMGRISREKLHDLDQAEEAFSRILSQFPKSRHQLRASRQLESIRRQRHREERRNRTVSATGAATEGPSKNFRPR